MTRPTISKGLPMRDIETWMMTIRAELDALRDDNEQLRKDNAALRALAAAQWSPGESDTPSVAPGSAGDATQHDPTKSLSRRGVLAAVAGAAGGMLLAQASPVAAANGDAVRAGSFNSATTTTIVNTTLGTGLRGESSSDSGTGVFGWASATTGNTIGVYGSAKSTSGRGVYGKATATSGDATGVYGETASASGVAVVGYATASSGATRAVYGLSNSASGHGLYGQNPGAAGKTGGFAVFADGRLKSTGRTYLGTPNTAPDDADLHNGSISFFLDKPNSKLKVRAKFADGSVKTATITLA